MTLAEEVALLSLDAARLRVHGAVAIACQAHPDGLNGYRAAIRSLEKRGMVAHAGGLASWSETPQARLEARRQRLLSVIRCAAVPEGPDAELLVLLAFCRALELLHAPDHMRAHAQIAAIDRSGPRAPAVELICKEVGVDSTAELADRLLPPLTDFEGASFDPGRSAGTPFGAF